MNYQLFRQKLSDFAVFSLADIHKAVGVTFDHRRLVEWQAKGYIRKIIRGFYMFADTPVDENIRFETANKVYAPSYISLESALAHYNFIPESIYAVTSISTRRTTVFDTGSGIFSYRSVKPSLFFGDVVLNLTGRPIRMASPEKAALDYLYLHTDVDSLDAAQSLRWNPTEFNARVNRGVLNDYAAKFNHKALNRRLSLILEVMTYA